MARKQQISFGIVTIEGASVSGVTALLTDKDGNILLATGTTVPTDGTAKFAKGCIFIKTNATGNGFYVNNGTPSSCSFKLVTTA